MIEASAPTVTSIQACALQMSLRLILWSGQGDSRFLFIVARGARLYKESYRGGPELVKLR
jgi:hypothetical protein